LERLAAEEGFRAISRFYRLPVTAFVRFGGGSDASVGPFETTRMLLSVAMRFRLIDRVIECDADRAVALKNVSIAEEYLADHFPGFPVLPGVFMIEAMVQAAREVLARRDDRRFVLGGVRALRYGSFVRPGEALRVEVSLDGADDAGRFRFKGTGTVLRVGAEGSATGTDTAVNGCFTMRPVR
jgi:3-hydroxymyristoyl/3-hydroxydecanoyl-(acyl carrier protein) dehydratase